MSDQEETCDTVLWVYVGPSSIFSKFPLTVLEHLGKKAASIFL